MAFKYLKMLKNLYIKTSVTLLLWSTKKRGTQSSPKHNQITLRNPQVASHFIQGKSVENEICKRNEITKGLIF